MRTTQEWAALLEGITPGPWQAITSGPQHGDHWHVADAGESIALVHASDGEDEESREPDARLLAAAPEAVTEVARLRRELEVLRDWYVGRASLMQALFRDTGSKQFGDDAYSWENMSAHLTRILDQEEP